MNAVADYDPRDHDFGTCEQVMGEPDCGCLERAHDPLDTGGVSSSQREADEQATEWEPRS